MNSIDATLRDSIIIQPELPIAGHSFYKIIKKKNLARRTFLLKETNTFLNVLLPFFMLSIRPGSE